MNLSIIILSAGKGKRMRSDLPKVLHELAGKTLLEHVYVSALRLDSREIHVVYGFGGKQVPDTLSHLQVNWIEQKKQLGTGHAVKLAMSSVPDTDTVLILFGDVPLITHETLQRLVDSSKESGFSLLTAYIDDPAGYGRVIRDNRGDIIRIREEKDATEEERSICEINTGVMSIKGQYLKSWLKNLGIGNVQGEYYLTDVIEAAVAEKITVNSINPESIAEIRGINNRAQLTEIERYYQLEQARHLMRHGVTLMDPARFDLRGDLEMGKDICIDVNVVLAGSVRIGSNVTIGPNCFINHADIHDDVTILPNCVIENAVIGKHCRIGPFARIRPDTRLAEGVRIGNFVEVKKANVGMDSKINHLSYVGDSDIGKKVNIGAGTITCNYDGTNKHKTKIGDNVSIGSDTQLIAPVSIGKGATIGAGTTVTKDVKAGTLITNKVEHKVNKGWKRPRKK